MKPINQNATHTTFRPRSVSATRWREIKHERHTHFHHATLENALSALSALLIANIYFANANGTLKSDLVPSKLLLPRKLIKAAKPDFSALKLKMP